MIKDKTNARLFPSESESSTYDYHLDIRLRFNRNNILVDYTGTGHLEAFDYPFLRHRCD
jgi:hypothetical protein